MQLFEKIEKDKEEDHKDWLSRVRLKTEKRNKKELHLNNTI